MEKEKSFDVLNTLYSDSYYILNNRSTFCDYFVRFTSFSGFNPCITFSRYVNFTNDFHNIAHDFSNWFIINRVSEWNRFSSLCPTRKQRNYIFREIFNLFHTEYCFNWHVLSNNFHLKLLFFQSLNCTWCYISTFLIFYSSYNFFNRISLNYLFS